MRLWCAFLGGKLEPGRMGEDHETVFVVAPDEKAAVAAAKRKWAGVGRPHVDAIRCVDHVDGFDIAVTRP